MRNSSREHGSLPVATPLRKTWFPPPTTVNSHRSLFIHSVIDIQVIFSLAIKTKTAMVICIYVSAALQKFLLGKIPWRETAESFAKSCFLRKQQYTPSMSYITLYTEQPWKFLPNLLLLAEKQWSFTTLGQNCNIQCAHRVKVPGKQ